MAHYYVDLYGEIPIKIKANDLERVFTDHYYFKHRAHSVDNDGFIEVKISYGKILIGMICECMCEHHKLLQIRHKKTRFVDIITLRLNEDLVTDFGKISEQYEALKNMIIICTLAERIIDQNKEIERLQGQIKLGETLANSNDHKADRPFEFAEFPANND